MKSLLETQKNRGVKSYYLDGKGMLIKFAMEEVFNSTVKNLMSFPLQKTRLTQPNALSDDLNGPWS